MDGETETVIGKEAWDTLGLVGLEKNSSLKESSKQVTMNISSERKTAPERSLSAHVSGQQAVAQVQGNITRRQKLGGRQTAIAWTLSLHLAVVALVVVSRFPCAELALEEAPSLQQEHAEENKDDTVYCETGRTQEGGNNEQDCVTCPQNAECTGGMMACLSGYTPNKDENGYKESPTVCVEDTEKKAKAAEVLKLLVEILRERQGRYDCGYPLDPLFSPSEQLGGKPWSNTITKMCSGPGLSRWQMNFHREIGPAIADEGVYFWLFYHFLTPEAAAKIGIQVERQYLFVPLSNPVDFPELHERLMREQARAKGITFIYTYTGSDTGRLTVERVDEACHELLWKPETGVHAYRINETNHWWAERELPPSSSGEGTERESHPSCWNDNGPTVGSNRSLDKPTLTTSKSGSSLHRQSNSGRPHTPEDDSVPSQYCNYEYSPTPVRLRDHDTAHGTVDSFPLSAFGQEAAFNQHDVATAGAAKPARGLDDYSGLMRELRELQRASHTLSGELAREKQLRSPYR
ncbi:hypothetical protein, conserved [Eimeria brunetti]|uniref:Man1/Src1-like C-terminal domain-containing protein n=1 Tax=Eimeria brunetti TaxID=51314 RepID=U6LR85_9EIME|nr:hypothetical protein, conserved [Eimeria brunetti]